MLSAIEGEGGLLVQRTGVTLRFLERDLTVAVSLAISSLNCSISGAGSVGMEAMGTGAATSATLLASSANSAKEVVLDVASTILMLAGSF